MLLDLGVINIHHLRVSLDTLIHGVGVQWVIVLIRLLNVLEE